MKDCLGKMGGMDTGLFQSSRSPGAVSVPQSPLAFACPLLESEFLKAQRANLAKRASIFLIIVGVIFVTCWVRTFPGEFDNIALHVWNAAFVLSMIFCTCLLQEHSGEQSITWTGAGIFSRLIGSVHSIVMRAVFREQLGRNRMSLASFARDYLHAGACLSNLAFPSIGLPLPYWPHMAAQLLSATFTASHNGWLCVERLDSPHLPETVKVQETWLRTLTIGTRALLGSTKGSLEPYEEIAICSCETTVAAAQWVTALLFMQFHVYEEYRAGRAFLRARSHRFAAQTQQNEFMEWPFGSPSGIYKVGVAFAAPVVMFAAAWQGWLIMLHWLVNEWHVGGHTPSPFLQLPYAFTRGARSGL
eukprot:jgi/Botrbrau1/2296/Bobra.101_2s0117.1